MSKVNWFLLAVTALFSVVAMLLSIKAERAEMEVAYLQGELKVCNTEEELSKKTTDTCLALVDVCNERLSTCVQNNETVLRTLEAL